MTQHSLPLDLEGDELEPHSAEAVARELVTVPCAGCGGPVVAAHDATAGCTVMLDPGPRAYFVIGERTDGRPIVALTSNGLMPHRCHSRRTS